MSNHYASVSMENTPEIESGPLHAETPLSFKSASEHKVVKLAKKVDAHHWLKLMLPSPPRATLTDHAVTRSTSNIHKRAMCRKKGGDAARPSFAK